MSEYERLERLKVEADRWIACLAGDISAKNLAAASQGLRELIEKAASSSDRAPVEMLMFCPRCSAQHVDEAKGEWTNPPHATHTCQQCGLLWRPSNVNTTGIKILPLLEDKHRERILASYPSSVDTNTLRANAEGNELVQRLRAAHGRGGNSSILCGKAADMITRLIILLDATQKNYVRARAEPSAIAPRAEDERGT